MFWFNRKETICAQIPLNVKGKLFVSPMPFGPYDPGNALLKIYKQNHIEFVILLITDSELEKKAKRNLLELYKKNGIQTLRFPIADYTSPKLSSFSKEVDRATGYLRAGAHVAVHCNAGVGRTGVMACCIVRDILKMDTKSAIAYVKQYMKTEMTDEQIRLVSRFTPLSERIKRETSALQDAM